MIFLRCMQREPLISLYLYSKDIKDIDCNTYIYCERIGKEIEATQASAWTNK